MSRFALMSLSILAVVASTASAAEFGIHDVLTDTDLAPARMWRTSVPTILAPDQIFTNHSPGNSSATTLTILRQDHGNMTVVRELPVSVQTSRGTMALVTDANGTIQMPQTPGCTGNIHVVAKLSNNQFEVNGPTGKSYQIAGDIPCAGQSQFVMKADSNPGQALGIWQIATHARAKLNEAIGLSFWAVKIPFVWPAQGDFYNGRSVNITRGDYWDVVGHEMGHAIYDQGALGEFGGGEHKIDECYSQELALSEGWASFFSGWVSVDLADPDAKFENMVPRRAPIRFETIPADVCKGETNEWRVIGFFWDLVDTHDDGETAQFSFAQLWNILKGTRVSSASEAMLKLEQGGIDANLLRLVWQLNFETPSRY